MSGINCGKLEEIFWLNVEVPQQVIEGPGFDYYS